MDFLERGLINREGREETGSLRRSPESSGRCSIPKARSKISFKTVSIPLILAAAIVLLWVFREPIGLSAPRPNLILVTLDTTRADRLGCYGYEAAATPHLDALAAGGALFENARVQVPGTLPSHASMMTGTNPTWHGIDTNHQRLVDEGVVTLAESLQAEGFRTHAVIGAFVLGKAYGLAQGFDGYDDAMPVPALGAAAEPGEILAEKGLDRAVDWIGANGDDPFFLWWHIYDPHAPFEPPPLYRHRFQRNLYDGEIAYVDSVFGRLMAALEKMELRQNTFIAVIGDHGESLGDHDEDFHGFFVYNSTLSVPLIVNGPGVPAGVRVKDLVRSIDLAPTLHELLGCAPEPQHQGRSLRALMEGETDVEPRVSYFESKEFNKAFGWAVLRGVETMGVKYFDQPIPELYFLDRDPGELENRAAHEPRKVDEMRKILDAVLAESASGAPRSAGVAADGDALKKLIKLGYMSGGSRTTVASDKDPKEYMDIWDKVRRVEREAHSGNAAGMRSMLEEMVAQNPDILVFRLYLGYLLMEAGEFPAAIEHFKAACRSESYRFACSMHVAGMCAELKRYDEAREFFAMTLDTDPYNVPVLTRVALLAFEMGDREAAAHYAQRALDLAPDIADANRMRRLVEMGGGD